MDAHDTKSLSYLELAQREAPGLGISVPALARHLRHTGGDVEAAVERYLSYRDGAGGTKPVVWEGRTFPTRQEFIAWLAEELDVSAARVSGRLYGHGWDIAGTIAHFRKPVINEPSIDEPELPLPPEPPPPPEPAVPSPVSPVTSSRPRRTGWNAIPLLYGETWFESKTALARHIEEQGALSYADVLRLLYPPVTEDLQLRLDYFSQRMVRLRTTATDHKPGPLIYAGRLYARRGDLVGWLVEKLEIPADQAATTLFALDGDVTAEIEGYCRAFGYPVPPPDPDAFPLPIVGAPSNGHAGNGAAPHPMPVPETSVFSAVSGAEPAIAGPLGMIAAAFAAQQAELAVLRQRTAAPETPAEPAILRELQTCNAMLDRLAGRLSQLERAETEQRRDIAGQVEMVTVILHKIGQVAHDFEQMRSRVSPVPRHTRQRPLGTER